MRTLVLVALVPLVAFTVFVIATHRTPSAGLPESAASAPSPRSSGVIFVVPVSAPSATPAPSR